MDPEVEPEPDAAAAVLVGWTKVTSLVEVMVEVMVETLLKSVVS